jgi:hypothetical protein
MLACNIQEAVADMIGIGIHASAYRGWIASADC